MNVLAEILGVLFLGAGTYLLLAARETARENQGLRRQLRAQAARLESVEARLRYVEARLCGEDGPGQLTAPRPPLPATPGPNQPDGPGRERADAPDADAR